MKKQHRVFLKVFGYTMLLLVLMSLAAVALFSNQFLAIYREEQQRQAFIVYQPMLAAMRDMHPDEILETARDFANSNQSFKFKIELEGAEGSQIFTTSGVDFMTLPGENEVFTFSSIIMNSSRDPRNPEDPRTPDRTYMLTGYFPESNTINYGDLIRRSLLALGFMMIIAALGAVFFAFNITKPLEDEIRWVSSMKDSQRLFFSAASHELKTPIASARALVEGMIAGVGDYKDHPRYLRECLKTLDAQGNLVSEILEIVKLSDADTRNETVSLDVSELINSVLSEYRPLAEQRGLLIKNNIEKSFVVTNHHLLRKVLSNIMANAVQNTKEGEEIIIRTEERNHNLLRICIINTGTKIPEDELPKLFDDFYRLDTARTRNGTQTGLGLAIVKKSLDNMKIRFALENTSEGVLFWLDLPINR